MRLAIITVGYKSGATLPTLLGQLAEQTPTLQSGQADNDFKLYLVNNSSEDRGEIATLAEKYKFVEFTQNKRNTGYAGGNNIGLKKAFDSGHDWALLLNPDTEINNKDFISELKRGLADKTGLVGLPIQEPKHKVYGGQIEWLKAELKQNVSSNGKNFYIHGGAMAIHCATFEKLGPLDENYFLYFEDADYSIAAQKAGLPLTYLEKPEITHLLSASTKSLGSPTVLRYHYRNALYFNFKNGPWYIKLLVWPWSWWVIIKQFVKVILSRKATESRYIISGVFDFYAGRMGRIEPHKLRIGIECESIEGKNPVWGVGRIIIKLLQEIAAKPELGKNYKFVLYFKDRIPDDMPLLDAPIFEKKTTPVPGFPNRLFPIYYLVLLPIKLWSENLDVMFWPAYMLPFFTFTKSFSLMTEDVHHEAFHGTLPFRNRFFYAIWGTYSAKFSTKLMAISATSKKHIAELYGIDERRIAVNHLGVDSLKSEARSTKHEKVQNYKSEKVSDFEFRDSDFILYVGQAFPRRHLRETILAFEKIASNYKDLQLIAIGPDKYETPVIESLVKEVNKKLGRKAITHKDYVSDNELLELYSGAKALVYVSDREAFGLPPMEALSFGVPPIVADNDLGRELFGEYAFYTRDVSPEGISESMRAALSNKEKIDKIKTHGPEFIAKYNWKNFTDRWLETIRRMK